MPDALRLLLIATVFGLFVYVFFRAMFGTSKGYHEPPDPVDATGWTLVVDGSNFAHLGSDVRLEHLQNTLSSLRHYFKNADFEVFCDANLRHKFEGEDKQQFKRLVGQSSAPFTETHGQSADDVILAYAADNPRCIVVSNDWFSKGDEVEMRQGIPLLRIERSLGGEVFPHPHVNVFDDPQDVERRMKVPIEDLVGR